MGSQASPLYLENSSAQSPRKISEYVCGVGKGGGVHRSSLSLEGVGQPQLPSYLLQLREEVGAEGNGLLLSESQDPGLQGHCSLGTLWRNVPSGTCPSRRPGKTGRRWGSTQHRQKVLQSPPFTGAWGPWLSTAPHQPH